MNRFGWIALGVAVTGWGLAGALGGCSKDDTPAAEPNPDNSSGTSGTPPALAPPAPPPAQPPPPAAVDGGTDGAAKVSNPGRISCGAPTAPGCDAGSRCCWPDFDAGGGVCGDPCVFDKSFELACDETADCPQGKKCCVGLGEATCETECTEHGGIQLCKTAAECGNGGTCTDRECSLPDDPDPIKLKFRVCGAATDICK